MKAEYKEALQEMCTELDRCYKAKIAVLNLEMSEEEYEAKKVDTEKTFRCINGRETLLSAVGFGSEF